MVDYEALPDAPAQAVRNAMAEAFIADSDPDQDPELNEAIADAIRCGIVVYRDEIMTLTKEGYRTGNEN